MAAPFHYLTFRTFAHGTEDLDRVKRALLHAVGTAAEVRDMVMEGHHKNTIHYLEVEVKGKGAMDRFFRRLEAESPGIAGALRAQLDQRLDDDLVLYFRLAKQEAYLGRLVLATDEDAIQVRAKVAVFPVRADRARAALDEYLASLPTSPGATTEP